MNLVERLRKPVMLHSGAEQTNAERREAADEIERLLRIAKQRNNKKEVAATARNRATDGLEYWRAEAERLRAALTKMSECGDHPCAFCFEMASVAKAALEQKPT